MAGPIRTATGDSARIADELKAEYFIIIGARRGSRIIIGCIPTRILHEAMAPPGRLDLNS